MIEYRASKRLYTIGGPSVMQSLPMGAAATDWWEVAGETCIAAYQPKGAASLAASYVNLANPGTYDAAPGVAPTWDAGTGWSFSGTQQLTTGIVPNSIGANATYIVRVNITTTGGGTSGRAFDANSAGAITAILPNNGLVQRNYIHGGTTFLTLLSNLSGGYVMAIAGTTAYLNGSAEAGSVPTGSLPTNGLHLGNRSAADRALGGSIQAVAIYSTTLDAAQVASLSTLMASL